MTTNNEKDKIEMQKFLLVALLSLGMLQASSTYATYTVISTSTDTSVSAPLTKTDVVIQDGSDSRNRFTMHRLVRTNTGAVHKGTIILLPGLVSNFSEYMLDANNDPMQSFAAYLALANYDVYGYSPRTSNVPENGCSSGSFDCSVMATWGIATYIADIDYIRSQAVTNHPGEKPAIGGLSLGGMLGIAAVNAAPSNYSGLLMWEAMLYATDTTVVADNTLNCTADQLQIAAGMYNNDGPANSARTAIQVGELALVQLFGNPNPIFGTPNFINATPHFLHTRFQYTSYPRIRESIVKFNYTESNAIFRDVHCSLAGDTTFTNNLGNFTGALFVIKAGKAFGPYMQANVSLFNSASSVQTQNNTNFGHLDAFTSADFVNLSASPIQNWLDNVVFP